MVCCAFDPVFIMAIRAGLKTTLLVDFFFISGSVRQRCVLNPAVVAVRFGIATRILASEVRNVCIDVQGHVWPKCGYNWMLPNQVL